MDFSGGSKFPYLVSVVDRYGDQIEADLHHEFGLDLLDFFRGKHPWAKLFRLLGMLGKVAPTSLYITAQRADDEYVAQLAESGVDFTAQGEMSEDGYGPVEARLDNITDAISALQHTLLAVNGGKPGQFRGAKRPTNAIERYQEKQRLKRHSDLLDEVALAQEKRRQQQAG